LIRESSDFRASKAKIEKHEAAIRSLVFGDMVDFKSSPSSSVMLLIIFKYVLRPQ